jgi:hypothetical protein
VHWTPGGAAACSAIESIRGRPPSRARAPPRRLLAAAAGGLVDGSLQVGLEGPQDSQLALRFSSRGHVGSGHKGGDNGVAVGVACPRHQPPQLWLRNMLRAAGSGAQRLRFGAAQVDRCKSRAVLKVTTRSGEGEASRVYLCVCWGVFGGRGGGAFARECARWGGRGS